MSKKVEVTLKFTFDDEVTDLQQLVENVATALKHQMNSSEEGLAPEKDEAITEYILVTTDGPTGDKINTEVFLY
jgi:hypothetical protein